LLAVAVAVETEPVVVELVVIAQALLVNLAVVGRLPNQL
jgi:hypothetical protein